MDGLDGPARTPRDQPSRDHAASSGFSAPGGPGAPCEPVDPLVRSAIEGDHNARRAIWSSRRGLVGAVLLAHKPREAELEDLMQEVAAQFVAGIGSLREPGALDHWLRTIAMRTAKATGRRATVRRRAGERLRREATRDAEQASRRDLASDLASRDEARAVLDAAMELPDLYREPLLLRCVRGMSTRQIARVLDLSAPAVETRVARARRMLRERLERADPGAGDENPPDAPACVTPTMESRI